MPEHTINESERESARDGQVATEARDRAAAADTGAGGGDQADAVEALRREKEALQDRLLRTAAEFDNYRKRIDKERREHSEAAAADVLADLLPILDDLDRALQAMNGEEAEPYRKGVELIQKQIDALLRKRGVTPIETRGADFDPRYHQAVIHEPSGSHRDGQVMEELRRGYMLGDRLLRPAMVKVAQA